ncbi:MAG: glycosyltransferase [Ardenticatenaceae bacterium]|nr:glycosyltransferase [Anaerolineales bacterium]MCB8921721.1 glycosyltransferase [Ardenticatenaceae bacterium]MCB8990760.1 glycosyltransferase [Ardenticatenaceae bacterium]MCB9003247.1 glycosyltransferase [Ardenticatenaceae bacterium]
MASVLLLTPQLPYPPHQGTSLRNYHIIRGLAERHAVTLLSFLEENQSVAKEAIAPLVALCQRIETVPVPPRSTAVRLRQLLTTRRPDMAHRLYSPAFNQKLRQLLAQNQFDIVQIEGIELARAIEIVRAISPQSKIVFDDHNAETELQRRNLLTDLRNPRRWVAAAYSAVQVARLRRFERWACQSADAVTCVSDSDRLHLAALVNRQLPMAVIPNCIDVEAYQDLSNLQDWTNLRRYDLIFVGKMDYRPNVDAVLWFADEVWLKIKVERPSATWAIVGQKPHARLERLQELDGVTLTGWVDSVQPYLAGATVFLMPFRVGSGTRLKLIEAMAAGKAIVSTPIGVEGFPVQHGREILLGETAEELATAVLHLLQNPDERERLGRAARMFARQYDWRVVVPQFDEIYARIL